MAGRFDDAVMEFLTGYAEGAMAKLGITKESFLIKSMGWRWEAIWATPSQ